MPMTHSHDPDPAARDTRAPPLGRPDTQPSRHATTQVIAEKSLVHNEAAAYPPTRTRDTSQRSSPAFGPYGHVIEGRPPVRPDTASARARWGRPAQTG